MASTLEDVPSSSVRNGTFASASSSMSSSALEASGAPLALTASTSSSRSSLAAAVGAGFSRPAKKPPLASEVTASAASTMSQLARKDGDEDANRTRLRGGRASNQFLTRGWPPPLANRLVALKGR